MARKRLEGTGTTSTIRPEHVVISPFDSEREGAEERARQPKEVHAPILPPPPAMDEEDVIPQKKAPSRKAGGKRFETSSPPPSASFKGVEADRNTIPPDTQGAVGGDYVFEATNALVRTFSRKGESIKKVSLNDFWDVFKASVNPFDPKVVWDSGAQRFLFVACANARKETAGLLIGYNTKANPSGDWVKVYVPLRDQGYPDDWLDYPSVGFSNDKIVVQASLIPLNRNGKGGAIQFVYDKPAFFQDSTRKVWSYRTVGAVPARGLDAGVNTVYLLQTVNASDLALFELTGTVARGDLKMTQIGVVVPPETFSNEGGNICPQKGTSVKIDAGSTGIYSALQRNGNLWFARTAFFAESGSPIRCTTQWGQLTTRGQLLQSGFIDSANENMFYAFPSLAVNKDDHALIGFSCFSSEQYAGAGYAYRTKGDPQGTIRLPWQYQKGEATYTREDSSGRIRWGDYSATVVDPANDKDFWVVQEYAKKHSDVPNWSTRWAKVLPTPDPSPGKSVLGGRFQVTNDTSEAPLATVERWGREDGSEVYVATMRCASAQHGKDSYGYMSFFLSQTAGSRIITGGRFRVSNEDSTQPWVETMRWGSETALETPVCNGRCFSERYGSSSYGYLSFYLSDAKRGPNIQGGRWMVSNSTSTEPWVELSSWGVQQGDEIVVAEFYCYSDFYGNNSYGRMTFFLA